MVPELPDLVVYLERLDALIRGRPLERLAIANPFVLRSVSPTPDELGGHAVERLDRIGKRLVISLEGDLHIVIHLMIAGRLRWRAPGRKPPGRMTLATFAFANGCLFLTEAGRTRRASLYLARGSATEIRSRFDRGGLEPLAITAEQFAARVRSENHTLKRTLTDPRLFSGIGNAYSDEILHRARLSPMQLGARMSDDDLARLYAATVTTLVDWTQRLRDEVGDGFPEQVTAFREGMAVHGRYREPCPDCGAPVQRIRYAANETNYCARCQTGGRLLADRAMSRLLRQDWPRTLDDVAD